MLTNHRNSLNHKEMLKNLDVLAFQEWTQEQIKEYPSLEKAEKQLADYFVRDDERTHFINADKAFSLGCDLSEFKKYGPGVYLAFRFVKYILVVMGCLMIFPIANMIIFIFSEQEINGTNMETILQTTTLSSLEHPDNLVIGFNFIVLLILTLSLFYWRHLQTQYVLECTKQKTLTSYFTVILTKIPNYYHQSDLKEHLEKHYGKVIDIYTPKNYQEDLLHYQELSQVIDDFKQEREIYLRDKEHRNCLKMVQNFIKFKEMHEKFSHTITTNKQYEPYCAFVTFETVRSRNLLLEESAKSNGCWKKEESRNNNHLYKDQILEFRACKMQPEGILWENLNVPYTQKLLRYGLIIFVLGCFLMIAISIFFILAAAEASLYQHDITSEEESEILNSGDPEKIRSFCIELGLIQYSSYSQCQHYISDYKKYFALYLAFPVFVTVLKMIFSAMMQKLVRYRRHKYQFYKIHWEVIIITLFYFIKTALIKWVMYRSFSFGQTQIKLITVFQPFLNLLATVMPIRPDNIHLFQDFNSQWVAHVSHKVILIGLFSFNFSIIFYHCSKYIVKKCRQSKAQTKHTQSQMNELVKGHSFDFEFIYAEMLALFLLCMLYFVCIPIIYPAVFLSLLLLYWVIKYKFIRLDSKPEVYSHSISEVASKVMVLGLAMNSLVSPLYYAGLDENHSVDLLQAYITYWYYLVLFVFIIFLGFFETQTFKYYYFIKNKILKCISSIQVEQTYQAGLSMMQPSLNELRSYSMYKNPKYSQLLKAFFLLNRTELNHFAYIPRDEIEEIKQNLERDRYVFKLFDELCLFLSEQIKKGEEDKYSCYAQHLDRLRISWKMMEKIKEEAENQIQEEDNFCQFTKSIVIKMKQINANSIMKRSEQLSNISKPELFEDGLETETRIHKTLN